MLKPYARSLTGVDLSPGMLAKARAREAYDRLHEDEITHFLAANVAFDVIASADTLCYFGDLELLAQRARRAFARAVGSVLRSSEATKSKSIASNRMVDTAMARLCRAYSRRQASKPCR